MSNKPFCFTGLPFNFGVKREFETFMGVRTARGVRATEFDDPNRVQKLQNAQYKELNAVLSQTTAPPNWPRAPRHSAFATTHYDFPAASIVAQYRNRSEESILAAIPRYKVNSPAENGERVVVLSPFNTYDQGRIRGMVLATDPYGNNRLSQAILDFDTKFVVCVVPANAERLYVLGKRSGRWG